MNAQSPTTAPTPVQRTADCWDWLTPDDAIRHALAAYYAVCRYLEAAQHAFPGEDHDRKTFLTEFVQCFEYRVSVHGHEKGLPHLEYAIEYLKGYTDPDFDTTDNPEENPSNRVSSDLIHCGGLSGHCGEGRRER